MSAVTPRGVVVTGLSGSGKSVVTRCFEDLGYRCVDNLPLDLIEPLFAQVWPNPAPPWVVVVDVRVPGFAAGAPGLICRLKERYPELRVVFVEASDESIERRFSETRRPHPYRSLPLREAIAVERADLAGVRAVADEILVTSGLTPHELRALVAARFSSTELALPLVVRCESFGYRYGLPPDANLLFDVRCLPNPHFVPGLRPMAGDDQPVKEWLEAQPEVEETWDRICSLCDLLVPAYRKEGKSWVLIAFGCTGGRHRSVYFAERLAAHLSANQWAVTVQHRDRDR
ncbi:MAG TPA: RNase adapter RapZ [Thermoanaerobaculaceae bacterium]|nr:RNase adapter RapZ [Thermoanaerobaculaceae bacterium]